jgi:hypothetical protein
MEEISIILPGINAQRLFTCLSIKTDTPILPKEATLHSIPTPTGGRLFIDLPPDRLLAVDRQTYKV